MGRRYFLGIVTPCLFPGSAPACVGYSNTRTHRTAKIAFFLGVGNLLGVSGTLCPERTRDAEFRYYSPSLEMSEDTIALPFSRTASVYKYTEFPFCPLLCGGRLPRTRCSCGTCEWPKTRRIELKRAGRKNT